MSIISLGEYRDARDAARAYHPAVWTPQDSIDTAQEFAAELAHAERGVPDKPRWTAHLFGRSRFRRARILDGLAVALLMVVMAAFGVIVYAASAKASPATDAYEVEYGPAACSYLSNHSTLTGLFAVILDAEASGLSPEEAGEAVASSVIDYCPVYIPLLRQFVARYGNTVA